MTLELDLGVIIISAVTTFVLGIAVYALVEQFMKNRRKLPETFPMRPTSETLLTGKVAVPYTGQSDRGLELYARVREYFVTHNSKYTSNWYYWFTAVILATIKDPQDKDISALLKIADGRFEDDEYPYICEATRSRAFKRIRELTLPPMGSPDRAILTSVYCTVILASHERRT